MSATIFALSSDAGVIKQMAMFTDYGVFIRDDREWVLVDENDDDDPIDGLMMVDSDEGFVSLWDSAEETGGTLLTGDVPPVE